MATESATLERVSELLSRSFSKPDEVKTFEKGKAELLRLGDITIGRVTFQPGWKLSECVKSEAGAFLRSDHFGYVLSGRLHITADDGTELTLSPGDIATVPADHDGEVVGNEPFVAVDFIGAYQGHEITELLSRSFSKPDEVRTFDKGKVELLHIGGIAIGRVTFQSGWKWSESLKSVAGTDLCEEEHLGYALSGRCKTILRDGKELTLSGGNVISIPAGHDGYVVGNEPFVAIDFIGMRNYGR